MLTGTALRNKENLMRVICPNVASCAVGGVSIVAAAVGLAFGCAPAAEGSGLPPWSEPVAPLATGGVEDARITFAADGMALVTWQRFDASAQRTGQQVVWRTPAGAVVRRQTLAVGFASSPLPMAADRFAVLGLGGARSDPRTGAARVRLSIGLLRPGAPVGRFRTLATFVQPADVTGGPIAPAIAVDRDGEIAVAWSEATRLRRIPGRRGLFTGTERLRLAVRRPGGGFRRPRTVATRRLGGLGPVALAYARGRLLIAFAGARNGSAVRADTITRVRARTGRLSRPERVGPADRSWGIDLHAAAGPDGTMAVAWGSRVVEECPTGRKQVYATVRGPRARSFSRARHVGAAARITCESRTIDLIVDGAGRATVAWSQRDSARERSVRIAMLNRAGRVMAREHLGSGDFGDLALAPDGTALVTWDDGLDPLDFTELPLPGPTLPDGARRGRAFAALRPPGGTGFGPPELVSAPYEDVGPPRAAFEPRSGLPVLLWWSYRLTGTPPIADPASAALHTAVRAPA